MIAFVPYLYYSMDIFDIMPHATIVCYAITEGLIYTGNTSHIIDGKVSEAFSSLVICQYPNDDGYYLLYFNNIGENVTDTWHETIEDAKDQAEYEYSGITDVWISKEVSTE